MYSEVKEGDKFLVSGRVKEGIYPVTNVTPKRFEVGGYTFNKSTGYQVGGDSYSQISIKIATEDIEYEFNLKLKKIRLTKVLNDFDFSQLELDELIQVKDLINSFKK